MPSAAFIPPDWNALVGVVTSHRREESVVSETMPPQGNQALETPDEEMLPPAGPDEVRPQDPTEEGLPEDEQGGDQTVEELQQGGSNDYSGEGGGPA
jgi:hypothetical protein